MDSLPDALIQYIMSYMNNAKDVVSCTSVSTRWKDSVPYLVQESSNIQFARLEELKRRIGALNPSRSSSSARPQLEVIFEEQMVHPMGLFQCYVSLMILLDMLIKGVARGKEENRARDLFFALWVPDLFMKRVQSNGTWSLFCPSEASVVLVHSDKWCRNNVYKSRISINGPLNLT